MPLECGGVVLPATLLPSVNRYSESRESILANYLDYASNHAHMVALGDVAARLHLKVAICYEDQTVTKLAAAGRVAPGDRVEHARGELRWPEENWFRSPAYLRVDGRPLLLSFGQEGLNDLEWTKALEGLPDKPLYLSEHNPRTAASGAFDWPIPKLGLKAQEEFEARSKPWKTAMPVAFPRFDDI